MVEAPVICALREKRARSVWCRPGQCLSVRPEGL